MYTRKDVGTEVLCDECGARVDVPSIDLGEVAKDLRKLCWQVEGRGNSWTHYCDLCGESGNNGEEKRNLNEDDNREDR